MSSSGHVSGITPLTTHSSMSRPSPKPAIEPSTPMIVPSATVSQTIVRTGRP